MSRSRGLIGVVAIVGALVVPAAAQAADYYVAPSPAGSDANPCSQAAPCATILHTVGVAVDGDTVHLAAGTYAESVTINKNLNFVGAGPGTPSSNAGSSFIHPSASGVGLNLEGGGSISNIRVRGNDGNGNSADAIELQAFGSNSETYSLQNVIAIGGQDTTANTSQIALLIASSGSSHIQATVSGLTASSGLTGGIATKITASTSATAASFTNSAFSPGSGGFGIFDQQGSVALTGSKVNGDTETDGINASGPLAINRSEIDGENFGIAWSNGPYFSLVDSLVVATPPLMDRRAVALDASSGHPQIALIQGSTIISRTADGDESGLELRSASTSPLAVSLVNSIVRDRKVDGTAGPPSNVDIVSSLLTPGGVVDLTASHSSFSTVNAGSGTTLPAAGSGTNFAGDPGFVSFAGGAYDLAATSPLLDQGDPAAVSPGELDFAGQPRSVDGTGDCLVAPDPGAYEFQANPGSIPAQPIRTALLARKNESVELETDDNGFTYTWSFSDGGSATGAQVNHRFTKAGTQTATVTSSKGTCVGTTTKSITIDGTPPKFSAISVKHRKLRYHANESASVVVYFFKKSRGKYRLAGHVSQQSHRGTNTKKLPKRLGGKPLRGPYELKFRGSDKAGNRAKVTVKKLRI